MKNQNTCEWKKSSKLLLLGIIDVIKKNQKCYLCLMIKAKAWITDLSTYVTIKLNITNFLTSDVANKRKFVKQIVY